MKILFIHNRYQYKGGEDTTLEVEQSLLKSKGHAIRVLLFDNDSIKSTLSKLKVGVQSFYNVSSAKLLAAEIRSFQPDVIHIHNLFFKASPSILYQAARLKIPVITTIQNYRLVCANALLLRNNEICELCIQKTFPLAGIKNKCYRSSAVESALVTGITSIHKLLNTWNTKITTIIVPSYFMKNRLLNSSLRLPEEKIVVKRNFVHDEQGASEKREDFFLFVGRLSKEKGIDTLLECFERNTDLKLVIAGDGPDKDRVLSASQKTSSISYIGHQPKEEILKLMRKSKALVFPSIWYEGLPLTIVEAFSTGTPVIASKIGAMSEMIEDDYNGFHFIPKDAYGLEQCLRRLVNAGDLQSVLGKQARLTYEEKFHPDVHYAAIISIYQKAIERNLQQ